MIDTALVSEHLLPGRARTRVLEEFREGKPWTVDLEAGQMKIGDQSFGAQLLATYSLASDSFLWAWANPNAQKWRPSLQLSERVRAHGGEFFGTPRHDAPMFSKDAAAYICADLAGGFAVFEHYHEAGIVYLIPQMTFPLSEVSIAYVPGVLLAYADFALPEKPPASGPVKRFLEKSGFLLEERVDPTDDDDVQVTGKRGDATVSLAFYAGRLESVNFSA